MNFRYLIPTIGLIIISGNCLGQRKIDSVKAAAYHLSPTLLNDWKKDPKGCLYLRCKYADSLAANKLLIGMPLKTFIAFFGRPSEKAEGGCYIYDVCSMCDINNAKLKDSDSSWLVFCFEQGKMKKCVMEIQ